MNSWCLENYRVQRAFQPKNWLTMWSFSCSYVLFKYSSLEIKYNIALFYQESATCSIHYNHTSDLVAHRIFLEKRIFIWKQAVSKRSVGTHSNTCIFECHDTVTNSTLDWFHFSRGGTCSVVILLTSPQRNDNWLKFQSQSAVNFWTAHSPDCIQVVNVFSTIITQIVI